ncbi:MAG TPA: 4Fe-4S dicluster domain-containing protein [Desulfomonilaceae bacterium]|nr:4Fe-4S dicluster domain-containing protein [Desulfomonilaceae bacterium]
MENTRRRFLQIAGLSVLGFGARPVLDAVAQSNQAQYMPGPNALVGKRWAMVVDQKKCLKAKDHCKDCVDACHRVHNVPTFDNPKDEVKWIWLTAYDHAFPGEENKYAEDYIKDSLKGLPFPVLCNHCDNPPCVRVCPVKATFRREDGIVMMDYHRCIGCRFCMAACPYGARSLNWRDPRPFIKTELNREFPTRCRGVVEKCNFCFERLSKGLKPACVEACKDKGLVFGDMEDPNSEVRELLRKNPTIRRKPQLGTNPQVYYIL